jgi:hypothetical protein
MGRYDNALTDFNHAIELDAQPPDWPISERGETYRLMGATTTRSPISAAPSNSTLPTHGQSPAAGRCTGLSDRWRVH